MSTHVDSVQSDPSSQPLRDGGPFAGEEPSLAASMSLTLVTVSPETEVLEAQRLADDEGIHHLVVLRDGDLVGVVCEYDLSQGKPGDHVRDCMRAPVLCIDGKASLREAAAMMQERAVGCLLVVRGELLLGIVTRGDLRRAGMSVEEVARPDCAACGTQDHVRIDPRTGGSLFCLECLDRASSPMADDETGVGD